MAERTNDESVSRINNLFDIGVLDYEDRHIYVTWIVWLRFQEYVPQRFVLPNGREKVLQWACERLRRPELNATETLEELRWQAQRISGEWEEPDLWKFEYRINGRLSQR